jgi:hypothetical protein
MQRCLFTFVLCCLLNVSDAQPFAIGAWQEHLPYVQGLSVATSPSRVYCATAEGFFALDRIENSVQRYSKLNGLSDFGIKAIAYSQTYGVLVIAYDNTNIDLLYDDDRVFNLNDIQRKNIPGAKVINRISIIGRYAYLSCGFGIVVLDLERKEIKDTYYISAASAAPEILDVCSDGNFLFAAADDGVYRAQLNDPFISNFNGWSKMIGDTGNVGAFNLMEFFAGQLIVNYSRSSSDTILTWNGAWGASVPTALQSNTVMKSMHVAENNLLVTESASCKVFDAVWSLQTTIDAALISAPDFSDAVKDANGGLWLADKKRGLISIQNGNAQSLTPEGPNSSRYAALQVLDGKLWAVHGPVNRGWKNAYQYDGFSTLDKGAWISYDGKIASTALFFQYNFYDNMTLAVDPSDKDRVFIGSGGSGLIEFKAGNVLNRYDPSNSPLQFQTGNPGQFKVHGIAMDDNRNLWVSNAGVAQVLKVLKPDGSWRSFSFPGAVNSYAMTGNMLIDRNGYIWVCIFENTGGKDGILVFNPNNTPDNTSDDEYEVIDFGANRIRSLAVDREGTIWAGSEAGIYVFYPPSLQPQQILIRQDNQFQYLLSAEVVTAIVVDAANRKWVGTESGGLYLFSADGTQQIQHFTTSNSPLFSNNITAVALDDASGMLYIATDKGLMSYQSDAIGEEKDVIGCKDVLVYPNPVKSEYLGPVAIRGLVPNGTYKITDIRGGLVFQSVSLGTQAVWDGRNLKGEKVSTGVYILFTSDAAGENTCTTKIMYYR